MCFNRSLICLYDKTQGSEYLSYNTYREVTLQANEYLLRDERFQNPVKDLIWSALEKTIVF